MNPSKRKWWPYTAVQQPGETFELAQQTPAVSIMPTKEKKEKTVQNRYP